MKAALEELLTRRTVALRSANRILESHEASVHRVVELGESFHRLSGLPVDVADYYRESLKALQVGCYRAAIVFAWSGFIFTIAEKLITTHHTSMSTHYLKWSTGSTGDLLESAPEAQILDAAKKVGLFKNQKLSIYKGWLSTRNQCAHPTLFQPSRNVALGFVDAVVSEIALYV